MKKSLCLLLGATLFAAGRGAPGEPAVVWSVGTFDGSNAEFVPNEKSKAPILLEAGKGDFSRLEWPNRTGGAMASPKYLGVKFRVPTAGRYTLQFGLVDSKPTPKHVVVWLDGKNIFREPLRSRGGAGEDNNLRYRENIPVDLSAGEHTVHFGAEGGGVSVRANKTLAATIVLDAFALVEGDVPLVHTADAAEPENWEARDFSDPFETRWEARDFIVRLKGLAPGAYTLQLDFQEDEVFAPGERVFDVLIGGQPLFSGIDIFGATGAVFKTLTKTAPITVTSRDGLDLRFRSTRGMKALVNELKVLRGTEVVLRRNCGFVPGISPVFATPATLDGRTKGAELILGMDESDSDSTVDLTAGPGKAAHAHVGVNIVANGDFEDPLAANGLPLGWTDGSVKNKPGASVPMIDLPKALYWEQGQGRLALDSAVKHGGKTSLRIAETKGTFGIGEGKFPKGWTDMDWTEPYTIELAVRGANVAGTNVVRIDWGSYVNHSKPRYLGVTTFPLPAGTFDWQVLRFALTPPPGASSLSVAITSSDNPGTLWVDDIVIDGFGSRPAQIMVSQGGYPTKGLKEAVVFTRGAHAAGGRFEVVDAHSGKVIRSGPLESRGPFPSYGRHVWTARFSDLAVEGRYRVRASFDADVTVTSFPFPINAHVFGDIAKLNFEYFRVIQANLAIPGWHGADNLGDAIARNDRFNPREAGAKTGVYIPALGNYYDAGDYSKKPMGAMVAVALAELDGIWTAQDQKYGLSPSDPLSVGLHGARFFKNTQRPDGGFYVTVLRESKKMGDPAQSPPGKDHEKPAGMAVADRQPGMPYALARFAQLLGRRDARLAQDYAHVADRALTPTLRYWDDFGGASAEPYKKLVFAPLAAGAAIALHQLMPGRVDLKTEADRRIREIIPLVESRVYDDKRYWLTTIATHNGMDLCHEMGFALAMLDYVEAYPKDPLTAPAKRTLARFIEEGLLPSMTTNPFGRLGEITKDSRTARPYLSPRYHNSTLFASAYVLARTAMVLNRPEWLDPAARQVYWGIGLNPRGVSFCMGVGEKNTATRTLLAGVPGHEDARIPGGVNKGFEFAPGRRGRADGYPMFAGVHDQPRDGYAPAGQEYWKAIAAYFLLATQQMQKAYDHFAAK